MHVLWLRTDGAARSKLPCIRARARPAAARHLYTLAVLSSFPHPVHASSGTRRPAAAPDGDGLAGQVLRQRLEDQRVHPVLGPLGVPDEVLGRQGGTIVKQLEGRGIGRVCSASRTSRFLAPWEFQMKSGGGRRPLGGTIVRQGRGPLSSALGGEVRRSSRLVISVAHNAIYAFMHGSEHDDGMHQDLPAATNAVAAHGFTHPVALGSMHVAQHSQRRAMWLHAVPRGHPPCCNSPWGHPLTMWL